MYGPLLGSHPLVRNIAIYQENEVPTYPPSLVAQRLKCLPMQETRVRSLGQEDPLEKEMATHSSILAQRIPWTEEPVHGVPKSRTRLSDFTFSLTSPTFHLTHQGQTNSGSSRIQTYCPWNF